MKSEENGQGRYVKKKNGTVTSCSRKQLTLKNSRKLKKNKESMSGLQKECTDNLLEIWRARLGTTHEDGREKVI